MGATKKFKGATQLRRKIFAENVCVVCQSIWNKDLWQKNVVRNYGLPMLPGDASHVVEGGNGWARGKAKYCGLCPGSGKHLLDMGRPIDFETDALSGARVIQFKFDGCQHQAGGGCLAVVHVVANDG